MDRLEELREEARKELFLGRVRVSAELGMLALRSLTLVNGAAVISLLTFIGNAKLAPEQKSHLSFAIMAFAAGVGFSLGATILGYIAAQREAWARHPSDEKESKESSIPRAVAIVMAVFALAAFWYGVWRASGAFIT
jgi:arginine exporter protein ArgO